MRLKNILIVVNDVKISRAFYKALFGLDVVTDFGENVVLTEGLVLQERTLFEKLTDRPAVLGGCDAELYFETNDMDGFMNKLSGSKYDIEFVNELMEHDWGKRVIRIFDPDHHLIEIGEAMEYVVRRFLKQGMTKEEVAKKTQLPLSYVEEIGSAVK